VFVPDLPGHGRSDKPRHTLDVPEQAEVLRRWMEGVGLRRAAFVANSMGCQIVAELAVRHPELVDRLVLVGPTADDEARTARQQVGRVLRVALEERPSLLPLVIADYLRAGPRRLVEELRAMLDHPIEKRLPRIAAPALVVRGEDDHISPQRWAEEVSSLLGADRVLVVGDAGHAPNYSDPDELTRLIRPFLRETSAAAPAASPDSR
jgi:pimeloyl-ACP methyl ester carboxylesterase